MAIPLKEKIDILPALKAGVLERDEHDKFLNPMRFKRGMC